MTDLSERIYERFTKPMEKLARKNQIVWLLLQLGWLHEGCHYLAARLIGVKVYRVTNTMVKVKTGSFWQMMLVGLAPAIPGLLVFIPTFYIYVTGEMSVGREIFYYLIINLSGMWVAACLADFAQVGELIRSIRITWK